MEICSAVEHSSSIQGPGSKSFHLSSICCMILVKLYFSFYLGALPLNPLPPLFFYCYFRQGHFTEPGARSFQSICWTWSSAKPATSIPLSRVSGVLAIKPSFCVSGWGSGVSSFYPYSKCTTHKATPLVLNYIKKEKSYKTEP